MHRTRLARIAASAVGAALIFVGLTAMPAQAATAALGDPGTYGGVVYLGPSTAVTAGAGEATVSLDRYVDGVRTPIPGASADTAADGSYLITGLPDVPIYPRVHYNGSGSYVTDKVELNVVGGAGNRLYYPRLAVAYRYSGHVAVSAEGAASGRSATAGEVEVRLRWTGSSQPLQTTYTDASGNYSFARVDYVSAPKTFLEFIYHGDGLYPTWYDIGDGIGTRDATAALKELLTEDRVRDVVLGVGAGVAGTVLSTDDQPVDGMTVTVSAYIPQPTGGGSFVTSFAAEVDSAGHYAARGLDPQYVYGVSWSAPGYSFGRNNGGDLRWFKGLVGVEAYSISEGVDGTLYRKAAIDLEVKRGWDLPPFYESAPHASLLKFDEATDSWITTGAYGTDTSGRFTFGDLLPGVYAVRPSYTSASGFNSILSGAFEVEEGEVIPVSMWLYGPGNPNNIYEQYQAWGGLSSPLGAGMSDAVKAVSGGYIGEFENGNLYTSRYGTWAVLAGGGILETYLLSGGLTGTYGWPIAEEVCDGDVCSQKFQRGTISPVPMNLVTSPVVTGTPRVGTTLTVSTGMYTPAATNFAYQWQRDGADIVGATSKTYVATVDDLGHTLRAVVVGWRSGRVPVTTTTSDTAPVTQGTLTKAPVPTIAGTVRVGSTLTAKPGTWPVGTELAYQWAVNGAPLPGATGSTLLLPPATVGKKITVVVTGTTPGYAPYAKTSASTLAVAATSFAVSPAPQIVGDPQVGVALTAEPGAWSPDATFRYQWYANGVAITSATASSFTPTGAQLGKRITVRVTASALGYVSLSRTSASSAVVRIGEWGPTPAPTISGTPQVGRALTATTPGWNAAARFAYQWYANGVAISGATSSTFTPISAYLGKTITVRITTTTSGYAVERLVSEATGPVAIGTFTSTPTPTITGTVRYGSTLTAVPGTWAPNATLRYQWLADGAPIAGATLSTLPLRTIFVGKQISVVVTGSRAGFTSVSQESAATVPVAERPYTTTVAPKVAGTARVGSVLTATRGTWSPDGPYAYQWYADGTAISGATSSKFTLTADQVGQRITVGVSSHAAGYVLTERLSAQTAPVVALAP